MTNTPDNGNTLRWWALGVLGALLFVLLVIVLPHPDWRTTWPAYVLYAAAGILVAFVLCQRTLVRMFRDRGTRYAAGLTRGRRGVEKPAEQVYVSHEGDEWTRRTSLMREAEEADGASALTDGWDYRKRSAARTAEQRARARLVVGVMTQAYEKSLTTSSGALFVALVLVGGYALKGKDRAMLIVAAVIAALFVLAVLRQAILSWRASKGYFGSSEHEVRELLTFAVSHPTPDDFFDDDGNVLPAFDLRPANEAASVAVGEAIVGAV